MIFVRFAHNLLYKMSSAHTHSYIIIHICVYASHTEETVVHAVAAAAAAAETVPADIVATVKKNFEKHWENTRVHCMPTEWRTIVIRDCNWNVIRSNVIFVLKGACVCVYAFECGQVYVLGISRSLYSHFLSRIVIHYVAQIRAHMRSFTWTTERELNSWANKTAAAEWKIITTRQMICDLDDSDNDAKKNNNTYPQEVVNSSWMTLLLPSKQNPITSE